MTQPSKALALATLLTIASSPLLADDTAGFHYGAGAGYVPAGELNLQPYAATEHSLAAFGGVRLNSWVGLEAFYADVNPAVLLSDHSGNLYTRSFLGNGLAEDAMSTVAGVSVVTNLLDQGPVRPFARAGVHHYDLEGNSGQPLRGDSLMLGAGANIDLSRGWNARFEWERYSGSEQLDRDVFSTTFEYKF